MLSLNGTFCTNDALHHIGEGESPDCKFCGGPDSIEHRVLYCPYFASCRRPPVPADENLSIADLSRLPPALKFHCWARQPQGRFALLRALQDIPDTSSVFEHVPHQAVYDLFTDGSCPYPAESYLRVAAWGVVVAGGLGAPGTLLATGHLPGLIQSAFRAELTAVISAAKFAAISHSKVRIWSDCLGVVKRFARLLRGDWSPSPSYSQQ